jgi:hypothetical protein
MLSDDRSEAAAQTRGIVISAVVFTWWDAFLLLILPLFLPSSFTLTPHFVLGYFHSPLPLVPSAEIRSLSPPTAPLFNLLITSHHRRSRRLLQCINTTVDLASTW